LQKLGYTTIDRLKEVENLTSSLCACQWVVSNPGKLANDLNGYKKKNKLDLPGLSPEIAGDWIKKKSDLIADEIQPQRFGWGFFVTWLSLSYLI